LGLLAPYSKLSATATNFTPSNLAELNANSVPDIGIYRNVDAIHSIQGQYNAGLANAARGPRYNDESPVHVFDARNNAISTGNYRNNDFRGRANIGPGNFPMHYLEGIFTINQRPSLDDEAVTRYILLGNVGPREFEEEASAQGPLGRVKQVRRLLRCTLCRFLASFLSFGAIFPLASMGFSGFCRSQPHLLSFPILGLCLYSISLSLTFFSLTSSGYSDANCCI
jgi:hypothetical protein